MEWGHTSNEMAENLFPVALNLRNRACVVVGGGAVGERKAVALLGADAAVRVVAPDATEAVRALAAESRLTWHAVPFAPEHLDGAFLAVAATDSPEVNRLVARAARERDVLLNLADASEDCGDFATMATVRRGDLLVALTTGGAGPALSARLRRELEARFGPEWAPYTALLGEMRREAKARIADPEARADALRRLAGADAVRQKIASGDADGAREEALSCLSR